VNKIYNISIVVVSLNTKEKLKLTLNSIGIQNFKDFELIVVDGNSKDGSLEVINSYKNLINKKIIEKDKGIYDAMNKGILLSSGKWCIFLNSGDIFYNNETLLNLSKYFSKDIDIIYGDTIVRNKQIDYLRKAKFFSDKKTKISFCHQSSLIKSNILKINLFSLKYKLSSDFDLFLRLLKKEKSFLKINQIISIVESGGVSDSNRYLVLFENLVTLKKNKLLRLNIIFIFLDLVYLSMSSLLKLFMSRKMNYSVLKFKYYFLNKITNFKNLK
tara:strand:+ start:63 stop:878 length:816 start_codon:yes stop_codon:yes gene_type:complete